MTKLFEIAKCSAKGGLFLFAGNTLSLFILAVSSIVVARFLGPDAYGLLSLALVVPSLLMGLLDFGVNSALTRFSAKLKAEGNSQLAANLLKSGLIFKFLIGLIMSFVCLFFSDAFSIYLLSRPDLGPYIRLASFLVLFQTLFVAFNSSFTGLDKMHCNALTMNVQAVMKTALSTVLVVAGFSIVGALIGHITSYLIASITGCIVFMKLYKGLGSNTGKIKDSFENIRVMISYGFPLFLSTLLTLFQGQYQTIILAFFASNTEIGNFSIAITLSSLLNVLIFPINALFPAFSKVKSHSDDLKLIFKTSAKYTALLIVPTVVFLSLLAKELFYILYGSSFNLAPLFFQIYSLNFLLTGLGSAVLTYLFNGVGETKIVFKYSLINLLVFLPLAPMLAMFYGVIGIILAFLVSNALSVFYGLFAAAVKIHVKLEFKESIRIYVSSFLSAIPVVLLISTAISGFTSLLLSFSIFFLVYFAILPLTGAIDNSDLENFRIMFGNLKPVWAILKPVIIIESKLLSFKRLLHF
ncbi:MAG: oligosaccharide flippase family protein [Candidatus Bathyarchaeia archaeon]